MMLLGRVVGLRLLLTSPLTASYYASNPLDLDRLSGYCTFLNGYAAFLPMSLNGMWAPCHSGRHAISDVYFEYGFRLPMHPIYLFVFEAFSCGLCQLVPNISFRLMVLLPGVMNWVGSLL